MDIVLGISPSFGSRPGGAGAIPRQQQVSASVMRAVFQRDHHVCRCCGFRSERYQEALVLDGNVRDVDNMVTLCIFCHQCFHLDQAAHMRSGILIWLPEVAQTTLHHVARDLYMARIIPGPEAGRARRVLDALAGPEATPRDSVRERLETDEPAKLAAMIRDRENLHRDLQPSGPLEGVRLFPLDRRILREDDLEYNQFPQILTYWRSRNGPFHGDFSYEWLEHIERELFQADEGPPMTEPDNPAETSHASLSAKLLRDAASFFRNVGEQNQALSDQMETNAGVYENLAELVEKNPTGRFQSGHNQASGTDESTESESSASPAGTAVSDVAARLLRDAATFFRNIGKQNQALQEQMQSNADVYEQVADLVERDPEGSL